MNVDVLTVKRPSRSKDSITLTEGFIFGSLKMIGDMPALARLRIHAREQDKYFIIKAKQATSQAA